MRWNWLTVDPEGIAIWEAEPVWDTVLGRWMPAGEGGILATDRHIAERLIKRKLHKSECVRLSDKTSEIIYF